MITNRLEKMVKSLDTANLNQSRFDKIFRKKIVFEIFQFIKDLPTHSFLILLYFFYGVLRILTITSKQTCAIKGNVLRPIPL